MKLQWAFSCFAVILLATVEGKTIKNPVNPITLEDVLNSKYSAVGYGGRWTSDNHIEYRSEGHIYRRNVAEPSSEPELLLDSSLFHEYTQPDLSFSFSPDPNFVLLTYDVEQKWRHSSIANYDIYKIADETFEPIGINGNFKLSLFKWAPTGNSFAFVHNNNIYYRESAAGTPGIFQQLTTDGTPDGTISNGHADWVYEEEMFGSPNAFWFSKDASHLAFVTFDDSDVRHFQYPMYGEPGNETSVYPTWIDMFYPKSGTPNPKIQLKVVALGENAGTPTPFTYDPPGNELNLHYIATVNWLTETTLLAIHLNRAQNIASYYVCDSATAVCTYRFQETSSTAWVDVHNPVVSSNGGEIVTLLPREVSTGVTYKQIVKINLGSNPPTHQDITKERFSVASILGWDFTSNKIYFSATGLTYNNNGDSVLPIPSSTHTYVSQIGDTLTDAVCLTCNFQNTDEVNCGTNGASFSSAFTYFIHTCSGPGIPEYRVRENGGVWTDFTSTITLQDNQNLRTLLEDVGLPKQLDYSILVPNTNFPIKIRLFVPPDFDEASGVKYPLLIDVYGGPGSQSITDRFRIDWGTSLVTDKKIIYGLVDGRGSGGQTQELLQLLYRKLGTLEVEDQIFAAKWLINARDFIDPERTAIWGWSYGGYATAMAMAIDTENIFKCGIAVAPVTSYYYYDTIYTERYMGLPTEEDNLAGYKAGDVNTRVTNFENKEFLLIHGNADDNVHYQQSMILARALELADIQFDQLSYADEAHSITGPRKHLYHSFERFLFRNCLKPRQPGGSTTVKPGEGDNGSEGPLTSLTHLTLVSLAVIWFQGFSM